MTWALIFMFCTRSCLPHYVEYYDTKAKCVAKISEVKFLSTQDKFCVPIVKGE
jgi:hypothetical protein